MSAFSKFVLFIVAVFATILIVRHGDGALHAAVPQDMPKDAGFIQSGFDLQHNEAKGEWIACRADTQEDNDWCRVTDDRGTVVYQGAFVPLADPALIPDNQLRVAADRNRRLWVNGPAESSPVPVISLLNGQILVPSQDRDALRDRWAANPDELRQIQGF